MGYSALITPLDDSCQMVLSYITTTCDIYITTAVLSLFVRIRTPIPTPEIPSAIMHRHEGKWICHSSNLGETVLLHTKHQRTTTNPSIHPSIHPTYELGQQPSASTGGGRYRYDFFTSLDVLRVLSWTLACGFLGKLKEFPKRSKKKCLGELYDGCFRESSFSFGDYEWVGGGEKGTPWNFPVRTTQKSESKFKLQKKLNWVKIIFWFRQNGRCAVRGKWGYLWGGDGKMS